MKALADILVSVCVRELTARRVVKEKTHAPLTPADKRPEAASDRLG